MIVESDDTSKLALSQRFVTQTQTALAQGTDLSEPDLVTLAIDRVHVGEHTCVVGIGIEQALIVTGRGRERERHPGHDLLIGYADSLDVSARSWW